MRISDWSSGVCSSDLLTDPGEVGRLTVLKHEIRNVERVSSGSKLDPVGYGPFDERSRAVQIFRASKNCSIFFKPLRLNEGLACIIKRPDHAVDQVPFAFHSRSEEHTSELQSLMRISYAVFCLKKKKKYIENI